MKETDTHLKNRSTIGQIIPLKKSNWREKVTVKLKTKSGNIKQTFAPIKDILIKKYKVKTFWKG